LWRWCISKNIIFLDIVHLPVYISNPHVSDTEFRLHVKLTQFCPIDKASPYLRTPVPTQDRAQLSRLYLKTKTESSLRNVVFWNIKRTMDNVQKHNICVNIVVFNDLPVNIFVYDVFFVNEKTKNMHRYKIE
jgi:hypothetical protein